MSVTAAKRIAWAAFAAGLAAAPGGALAGAVLHACAGGHPGFTIGPDPLAHGDVVVPKGTVFRFAGMPLTLSLGAHDGTGAPSDREAAGAKEGRRRFERALKADAALVTEHAVRLTRARRCADVPADALVSPRFGWSTAPVEGGGRLRLKPYGTVRHGHLSIGYAGGRANFKRAATRGEIEATMFGETTRTVHLERRDLDVIAHHRRRRHGR